MPFRAGRLAGLVMFAALLCGCSVKKYVLKEVGSSLSNPGVVFSGDEDPDLIGEALPFSLKLVELLLASSPADKDLLTTAASGFTQYARIWVEQRAEEAQAPEGTTVAAARQRALRLYLRARGYGLRGLEAAHRGFGQELPKNPAQAAVRATLKEVPLLFWTAASWSLALSLQSDLTIVVRELAQVAALADRALALDERWEGGAVHSLLIGFEMVRPGQNRTVALERARHHFKRAVELSEGKQVGPYVAFAESVAVPARDRAQFLEALAQAQRIDANASPAYRLANTIGLRRARWLLSREKQLFPE